MEKLTPDPIAILERVNDWATTASLKRRATEITPQHHDEALKANAVCFAEQIKFNGFPVVSPSMLRALPEQDMFKYPEP